jgi:Tfp pilus assembly protein PilZ
MRLGSSASSAVVENISAGGVFIRSARPLALGTLVHLDLVRPGLKKAIRVAGRVVGVLTPEEARRKDAAPGMGIKFDPLSAGAQDRLDEILRDLGLHDPSGAPAAWPPSREAIELPPLEENEKLETTSISTDPTLGLTGPPPTGSFSTGSAKPRNVTMEIELPRPAGALDAERVKLMNHIRGLLAQLGQSEERVKRLEDEVEELQRLLGEKDKLIGQLLSEKVDDG